MTYFRITIFSLLVLTVFLFPLKSPALCLTLFLILLSVYSISGGLAGIPFMDIVGRTIPHHRRGTFFGLRMTIGGALGILAGWVVNRLLVDYEYPSNFGLIFFISSILIALGLFSFFGIKEPELL